MLRGRDIQRYKAQWKGLWLIATFPALGLNIDDYPAVKNHLLSFGKARLEQAGNTLADGTKGRSKTNYAWFETQNTCAYHEDFAKEKLFWMDMSPAGRFAYSDEEMYCNDKGFIMTGGPLKYLCAILNSGLITWLMNRTALTTGMGVLQWKKFAVERLPIPKIAEDQPTPFGDLFDRASSASAEQRAYAGELREEIDDAVNALYGLSADEVREISCG